MISIESEERPWGRFFVLHDEPNYKLKRIEVDPGGKLSYQYHQKRSEMDYSRHRNHYIRWTRKV